MTTDADTDLADTDLVTRLTGLVDALRGHGLRIGTGETVDAARAVEALGLAERELLREGLAATLLHGAAWTAGVRRGLRPVLPARGGGTGRRRRRGRPGGAARPAGGGARRERQRGAGPAGGGGGRRLRRVRGFARLGRLVVVPDAGPAAAADAAGAGAGRGARAGRGRELRRPAAGGRDPAPYRGVPAAGHRGGAPPGRGAPGPRRDRPPRARPDRRPGRLPARRRRTGWRRCAARSSRSPASWPPGSRHAAAGPRAAPSTCAERCAARCRRAGCR